MLFLSSKPEETFEFAKALGRKLQPPALIAFFGDLGAGKTTFIKGLVEGATQLDASVVQSPTFTYMHVYEGIKKIYHFDLYRMKSVEEFIGAGFDDYLQSDGICCIEWSERIQEFLPEDAIKVEMCHQGDSLRLIILNREI